MNRALKKKQWNEEDILPSWSVRDLSHGLRNKCFLVGTKREIPKEHGGEGKIGAKRSQSVLEWNVHYSPLVEVVKI